MRCGMCNGDSEDGRHLDDGFYLYCWNATDRLDLSEDPYDHTDDAEREDE